MPRKPIIRNSQYPYHLWARCNNKEWYQIPMKQVWNIYSEVFASAREKHNLHVEAFVLMSNHFHALAHTPKANIDEAMMYVMRQTSLAIGRCAGRINKIYGGRYKSTLIKNDAYYSRVLRYIYQNPVKAGICQKVEQYPYSTVLNPNGFQLEGFKSSISSNTLSLDFYNTPENTEFETQLKKGLKRSEINLIRNRVSRVAYV